MSVVEAFVQIPFVTPSPAVPRAHVALLGVANDEVPIGTEVWALD